MVVEYVSGLKTAWELVKGLKAATDSLDDAQIKFQMSELISALTDAKIEAAENTEKIAELERIIRTKEALVFDGQKYYQKTEEDKDDGPFCPTCYDSDSKKIRLQYSPVEKGSYAGWDCKVCKCFFRESGQTSP